MKKILLFVILISFFSCSKTKSLVLKATNADGITNETKLKISGLEIGEISSVKLDENGAVTILANLESEIEIPVDSKFKIQNEGLIGGKIINISLGKSKQSLTDKSIVNLMQDSEFFLKDSIGEIIEHTINRAIGKEKNDSILIELRRLNDNLERRK